MATFCSSNTIGFSFPSWHEQSMEKGSEMHVPVSTTEDHDEKIPVTVEVMMLSTSTLNPAQVKEAVARLLEGRSIVYKDGPLDLTKGLDPILDNHVYSISISETDPALRKTHRTLLFWQYEVHIYVYQLFEDEAADDDEGEDGVPAYREWMLPAREFDGLWDSLYYDSSIKTRLLRYAASALIFAEKRVNSQLVSWNRVVLLHGPPGTGKTSLCKALAQKLTIKFIGDGRYRQGSLVEVNAHSLFSKWFSESGKLVSKLFSKITEMVEEEDTLVFVLIDEVESLTAARKAAVSGSEPSDAIRAVNALLTQLDQLKRFPNVMVLTTSNITEAIDVAFVDRADIKAYIGPPTHHARYEILKSAVQELSRAGIIADPAIAHLLPFHDLSSTSSKLSGMGTEPMADIDSPEGGLLDQGIGTLTPATAAAAEYLSHALSDAAAACEGLSGRSLRKLPFLAHAGGEGLPTPCAGASFIAALKSAALMERQDRMGLANGGLTT